MGHLRSAEEADAHEGVFKGIDSGEDAQLAVQHGVDGLIVSNHGGRALETLRPTIDACLKSSKPSGRVRVSRWRRSPGADIYKALASGARGVGIGRPYIWGLSAFGRGVERVLEILRAELTLTMRQMGTPTVKDITAARVARVIRGRDSRAGVPLHRDSAPVAVRRRVAYHDRRGRDVHRR